MVLFGGKRLQLKFLFAGIAIYSSFNKHYVGEVCQLLARGSIDVKMMNKIQ